MRIDQIGQFQLYEVIISFKNAPRDKALTARYLAWGLILSLVHPVRPRGPMMGGLMIPNCHASISPWSVQFGDDGHEQGLTGYHGGMMIRIPLLLTVRTCVLGSSDVVPGYSGRGALTQMVQSFYTSQAPCSVHIGTTSIACSIYVTSFCYTALQGPICIWGERWPSMRSPIGGRPPPRKEKKKKHQARISCLKEAIHPVVH